jgi:CubicO group peptidase (beta-lactamase class C family)
MFVLTLFPLLVSLVEAYHGFKPRANNDTVRGFDTALLKVLNAEMHKWVDDKNGANVVTLVAHKGEIINFDAYGVLDASNPTGPPVQKDTIFRIASMTKPIVGIGMAMMYEAGKWKLDDPVTKHIPEFANLKVKLANGTLVPTDKPITMAQIVSHSAGFPGQLTVRSETLGGIIPPLVEAQLAFQPGRDWRYGPGVEIQGYLIEKWSGKDLSDFLTERLFAPLQMKDTGFFVDRSKVERVTKLHSLASGKLESVPSITSTSKPRRLSPSGGLLSTAEDYFKVSQMILEGGSYKGKQYLKPETVRMMHTNLLEPDVHVGMGGRGAGFGVDYAIVLTQETTAVPVGSFYCKWLFIPIRT